MSQPRRPEVTDLVEIGRGGFGVVYRARQEQFRRDVAVKVISARLDERARTRFTQECRALGQLSGHPHIVPVYDGGVDPDEHGFLVMPYLAGGSLADRLARTGPIPWREAVEIGVRLAGALHTAHDAGILHRDLKPGNVLVDEYGGPRLADFGQARFADADVTRTGDITATPSYAAPEILEGRPATVAADVYSLAATVHALVRGRAPFEVDQEGAALAPVLLKVMSEAAPDLRAHGVPDPVWRVLAAALAKDPQQRPASALALGIALQRAEQELGLPVTPLSVAGTVLLPPALGGDRTAVQPPAGSPRTLVAPVGGATVVGPPLGTEWAGRPVSPPGYGGSAGPGAGPSGPGPRLGRRWLVAALAAVLVVLVVVGGIFVVRELTAPDPRENLLGSDLVLSAADLPGGWSLPDDPDDGPLRRLFQSSPDLLACLVLPQVSEGSAEGALDSRDLSISDLYVDDAQSAAVQTAGVITDGPEQARSLVDSLRPPGRCPTDQSGLALGLATDVDYEQEVAFEAVDLPDVGGVEAAGERILVPLTGSDGARTYVVELVFLAAGAAVAAVGFVSYDDPVPDDLRTDVLERLAALLTE